MALDVSTIGRRTEPVRHAYGWRDQALYALGIGARKDELAYLYEGYAGGMKVYPTYAVSPAFEHVVKLIVAAKADMAMIVARVASEASARPATTPHGRPRTAPRIGP
jgi:hypothetical protein